eukprot:2230143-Rhodomonas_salina.2
MRLPGTALRSEGGREIAPAFAGLPPFGAPVNACDASVYGDHAPIYGGDAPWMPSTSPFMLAMPSFLCMVPMIPSFFSGGLPPCMCWPCLHLCWYRFP